MLPHATQRMNLAGRDITSYLQRLITERGYSFKTSAEHQIIRDVKEKLCYVAQDFDKELQESETSDDCEALFTVSDKDTLKGLVLIGSCFLTHLLIKNVPGHCLCATSARM
jgi:actin-related protein